MKNIQKLIYLLPLLASLAVGACNVTAPTAPTGPNGTCGDGIIDAGEQCDLGAQNGQGMGCDLFCMTTGTGGGTSIDAEPNDTMAQAIAATTGVNYNGNTLIATDLDYYALSVTTGMNYDIVMSSCTGDPTMTIYNAAGTILYYNDNYSGLCSGLVGMTFTSAQTVYIVISPLSASNGNAGNYSFSIISSAVVTASLTSVTVSPATVTAGGSVTVTVVTNPGQTVVVWDSNWNMYTLLEGVAGTYTGTFFATGSGAMTIAEVDVGTTSFVDNFGIYYKWVSWISTGVPTASFTVSPPTLTSVTVSPATVAAGGSVTVTVVTNSGLTVVVRDSNWNMYTLLEGVAGTYTGTFFATVSGAMTIAEVVVGNTFFGDSFGIYNNWNTGISTGVPTASFTVSPPTLTSVTVSPATVAAGGSVTVTVVTNSGLTVVVRDSNWNMYTLLEGVAGTYTGTFFATGSGAMTIAEVNVGNTFFVDSFGIYNNGNTGISTGVPTASFTVSPPTLTSVTVSPATVAAGASVTVTVVTAPNQVVAVIDSYWTWRPLVEGVPGTYTGSFFAVGSGIVKILEVDLGVGTTIFIDNLGIYDNWATGVSTGVATASFTVTPPTLTSITVSPATVLVGGSVTVTVVTAPNQVVTVWAPTFVTLTEGIAGTYTGLVTASTGGVNTITQVDVGPVRFVDSFGIYSYWNTGISTGVATASFTATLPPILLTETFASIPANVTNGVLYPWVLDATKDAGVLTNSFASGTITHLQSSCYSMTVTGYQGFDFMYQTDSEASFDFLKVSVNGGALVNVASGQNLAWTPSSYYSLTGGVDTIQFCYTKGASVSVGLDKVWVDNINFH